MLQSSTDDKFWTNLLTMGGPIIGVLGGILMIIINKWWENRQLEKKKKEDSEEEDEGVNLTIITKFADLTKEERQQLKEDTRILHAREINFYQDQLISKDAYINSLKKSELAARTRSHKLGNELSKYINYVFIVREVCKKFHIDLPEFKFTEKEKLFEQNLDDAAEIKLLTEAREDIEGIVYHDADDTSFIFREKEGNKDK